MTKLFMKTKNHSIHLMSPDTHIKTHKNTPNNQIIIYIIHIQLTLFRNYDYANKGLLNNLRQISLLNIHHRPQQRTLCVRIQLYHLI